MYDLSKLKAELAELDAKRDPLADLVRAIEAFEESRAMAGAAEPQAVERAAERPTPEPAKRRERKPDTRIRGARKGPVTLQTVEIAVALAERNNRPVTTLEVVAAMRERAIQLPDKNPTNVISARLSNSEELEGHRGLGWWPTGKPLPSGANENDFLGPEVGHEQGGADVIATA